MQKINSMWIPNKDHPAGEMNKGYIKIPEG